MASSEFESDLHPKHVESLRTAEDNLGWLRRTWDETVLLGDPPSHLRSAHRCVRQVLEESGHLDSQSGGFSGGSDDGE